MIYRRTTFIIIQIVFFFLMCSLSFAGEIDNWDNPLEFPELDTVNGYFNEDTQVNYFLLSSIIHCWYLLHRTDLLWSSNIHWTTPFFKIPMKYVFIKGNQMPRIISCQNKMWYSCHNVSSSYKYYNILFIYDIQYIQFHCNSFTLITRSRTNAN